MPEPICGCAICQNRHPFKIPDGLVNDVMQGRVAVFAGAGISTENSNVIRYSLYHEVAGRLGVSKGDLQFPELMSKFCAQRDGRLKLVEAVLRRFSQIRSFSEMYEEATRFHRQLGTFFPIDTIVTTNWDRYFEDECHATPFIYDSDMALWDVADRKVLKLHGSIENVGSLVATNDDYARAKDSLTNGLIGARLKTILTDKTLIYVGYSFRDDDLSYINDFVASQLGALSKQAFIVTLDDSKNALARYKGAGLEPIITDATYFFECLKEHACQNYCFLPDDIYGECAELLDEVSAAHSWLYDTFQLTRHPQIVYCAYYQDGLQHLLKRVGTLRGSGKYSDRHRMLHLVKKYDEMRKESLTQKKYGDVAYIDGYCNGLLYVLLCTRADTIKPPLYYALGIGEIVTKTDYRKLLSQMPEVHKAGMRAAEKMVAAIQRFPGEELVLHHRPEL